VLSKDRTKSLLCKREGEEDYEGVFAFIGGKMETADASIIEGLKREKDEELGDSLTLASFKTNKLESVNEIKLIRNEAKSILNNVLIIMNETKAIFDRLRKKNKINILRV